MSSKTVLITGATGHLGFRTLLDALKAGYRVRAAVRSNARSKVILDNPVFKAANVPESQLSFIEVADLAAPHAYDEAVKGVDYVIHIASPITNGSDRSQEEYVNDFIEPAVKGTVGMLQSAAKEKSVKRVVITSSVVALKTWPEMMQGISNKVTVSTDRIPFSEGPYQYEFEAYSASKVKSLNEAEAWMKANNPSFDVVFIHPGFVEGRDDLALSAEEAFKGTNAVILSAVTGKQNPVAFPNSFVHNDDVAFLHVSALKPEVPAGSYIAALSSFNDAEAAHWEDINDIVAKNYPEAVKSSVLPNNAVQKSIISPVDSRNTEKVFGFKFQSFESSVKSVVDHYLELVKA